MAKLSVEIVTGERVVFTEEDVDMVIAPGVDGVLGILPRHAPLISLLANGELRIKKGGQEHSIVVFGGFLEVTPDKVVILADSAERAEEIDLSRAEAARRSADEARSHREAGVDLAEIQASLIRANVRLRVGQRRASRRGPSGPSGTSNEP